MSINTKTRFAGTAVIVVVLAVVLTAVLAACGTDKATEQFNDAPRGSDVNKEAANIIAMPDGYSNVAHKCDGPNMVYVIFHQDSPYGSVAVAPNDPRCAGPSGG